MRLAYLAVESGPLPPRLTGRIGVEAAGLLWRAYFNSTILRVCTKLPADMR